MSYEQTRPEEAWSFAQKVVLAITPKISASLSICGSSFIIHKILHRPRSLNSSNNERINASRDRILLLLSFCDLMGSTGFFFSTWCLPKDYEQASFVVWNIGNERSCNMQGYMIKFGSISAAFYNMFLSVFFFLCVRFEREKTVKIMSTAEPIFHFISIIYPFVTSISALLLGYFNPTSFVCMVAEYPLGCTAAKNDCLHGEVSRFRFFGTVLPVSIAISVMCISMILTYKLVRAQELTMNTNNPRISTELSTLPSRKLFRKATIYTLSFALIWFPVIIQIMLVMPFANNPSVIFYSRFFVALLTPSQGLLNSFILINENPFRCLTRSVTSFRKRMFKNAPI